MAVPRVAILAGVGLILLGYVEAAPEGVAARKKEAGARLKVRPRDVPPPCEFRPRRARAQAAPRSMPEMFAQMGSRFARDPSTGFQAFLGDLAQLEGPAFEGVRLSRDEERAAGRAARLEFLRRAERSGHRVVDDPEQVGYLKELVDGFAARMTHRDRYPEIDVTLVEADVSDGQTFPGGFLVFTTGLLAEPDEATVAAVVAHELAHLERGHMYEYARRGKLAEATYSRPPGGGGADFDRFFTRQMALFGLLMNPYRPEHELEADCTSVTWLYLEGYDPTALVRFFERLHRRRNDAPDTPFTFGRSHPFSLDRRRAVLDRLGQLQRWKARNDLALFPDNLRRRVSHFRDREG